MAIPDFQSILLPLLRIFEDDKEHSVHELFEKLAKHFSLTEQELNFLLGTRQGFEFQDILDQILTILTKPCKDIAFPVDTVISAGGSKKGDLLIEINHEDTDGKKATILIEAKREANKPVRGKTGILAEIDSAKIDRQADFGIAVFSEDACPSEVNNLRDYGNNRIICAIPADGNNTLAFEIAYILARTELCWQKRHISGEIDRVKVKQVLNQIEEKLSKFQGIKAKASSIITSSRELRTDLDNIESEIKDYIITALHELEDDDEKL